MGNCEAISVKFRLCHVSLLTDIGVRRMVFVPDRNYTEAMNDNQTVKVDYDIGNRQDDHALKAEVWVNDKWKNVGTIQKKKIPKLTHAMRQGTITGCRLASKPKYTLNVNKSRLNGLTIKLRISNHVRWGPDDPEYKYWQDLSHL